MFYPTRSIRPLLALSTVLVLQLASTAAGQGALLLSDDFSDGDSSDWITFEPGWSETGGIYVSTNTGANVSVEALYAPGLSWTDYTAEVDVRTASGRPTSDLRLHVRNAGNPTGSTAQSFGYCSLFRNNFSQTFLIAGAQGSATTQQQLLPFGWSPNTTYRLRATVSGQTLTCEVVGHLAAYLQITSPLLGPAGTVGLRATHIRGEFDNLVVRSLAPPNQPPTADAGDDQFLAANDACTALATLDGTGSSDPDGDALTYTWESTVSAPLTGPTPTVVLPLGSHELTLTVDDGQGGVDSDQVVVSVEDRTGPEVATAASPAVLWPPNHKLRPVEISVVAADNCTATPSCRITAVSSSEPQGSHGDGSTSPDWVVTGELTLDLRAERSGGSDRTYAVTVTCTDEAGNEASAISEVVVPRSR